MQTPTQLNRHAKPPSLAVAVIAMLLSAMLLSAPLAAQPPVARPMPDATPDATPYATAGTPPPKPLMPSARPIVLGWILFGVGTVATIGSLELMLINELDCDLGFNSSACESNSTLPLVAVTAGTAALIGLGIAIYGHAQRSNAKHDLRAWQRRYGPQAGPLSMELGGEVLVSVSPMVDRRRGLALTLNF